MQELIDFLQTNSALVLANPVPFATFALLFGSGGFVIGRYFLAERIANLESRIARRNEEIVALKEGRLTAEEPEAPMVPILATNAEWANEKVAPIVGNLSNGTEEKIRLSQA
jgi:hypothetical protein